MATNPVTLTPRYYAKGRFESSSNYSYSNWLSYSGGSISFGAYGIAFRFNAYISEGTLSNIRIKFGLTGKYLDGNVKLFISDSSAFDSTAGITIKSYSAEYSINDTASYNGTIGGEEQFYVIIYERTSYTIDEVLTNLTVEATATTPDKPDLTIEKIVPTTADAEGKVNIFLGNTLNESVKVEVTGNNNKLDGYTWYDISGAYFSSDNGISYVCYDEYDGQYIRITPKNSWFATAGESGNSLSVTVSAYSLDDTSRKAKNKTFIINRLLLDVTATYPEKSGSDSKINFKFNNRNNKTIYLKVTDGDGRTIIARTNITSDIKREQYSIVAEDSWFKNVTGDSMTVNILLEDPNGRIFSDSFTLKAGDGAKPSFKSVELSNYTYPQKYKDILINAGYSGYVVGYSQIKIRAIVKTMADVQVSGVVAKFNNSNTTLTYTGPDPTDSSYLIYEGTTTRTISSTSDAIVTVTATDSKSRSTVKESVVYSSNIQRLPNISLSQGSTTTVGDKLNINPSGYIGSYTCEITTNGFQVEYDSGKTSPYTPSTTYASYFKATGQTGQAYISLQVYITDALDRPLSNGYVTFRLNAQNPEFLSFTYENIPDSRMPETDKSGNPYGVVSGFSRVRLKATVRWYYDKSTVTVAGGYGAVGGTMTEGEGRDNEYGHKDIDYTFETEGVVATTSANVEFTPTAEDTGKDSYRTGKTIGTKLSIPITKLKDISLSVSPSGSVYAGATITVTPSNIVGDYDYVFVSAAKVELAKSDESISDESFTQECSADWFAGAESGNLSVELTVTDVLGRTNPQPYRFTVRLENLTLQVAPTSLVFGSQVAVSIGGTAGQTITVSFTTPNLDGTTKELYSFTTTSATPDPITCPKSWFDGFPNSNHLDITVTASYGSGTDRKEKSLPIKLNYPALGLAITDTSDQAVTSATVGDNLKYIFSNLEGETVNIDYVYQAQNNRSLLQYGPYSTAQTIATPQLFDMASPPVTKSPSMQISIVISDVRGRTATVSNFIINASDSMRPVPSNLTITPVNDGVDAKFADDFINNVTKYIATVTITPRTNAKIPESNVFLEFNSKRVQMRSIGNNQYQYASNDAIDGTEESQFSDSMALETFTVKATDERGMSLSSNLYAAVSCYVYNLPKAKIGYHRCNQDGTPNDSGDYCIVTCDYTFTGIWADTFPPSPQNEGYVTVSTSNYEETKQFDFTKWEKAQFTLVAGYGLNDSGEVVSNPLRAATTTPYIVPEVTSQGGILAYKVTFNGDYVVEYARWEGSSFIRKRTINSSGQYINAGVGESLYISLKRSNETSESAPVDITEANVQLTLDLGNSEDGSSEFLIPNMSIEQTYQITVTLADLISSTTYTVTLSTGGAIMDFFRGGKGVAIGKVAEHATMLEVNPDWELKASVKINGQLYDLATLLSQIKQQLGI